MTKEKRIHIGNILLGVGLFLGVIALYLFTRNFGDGKKGTSFLTSNNFSIFVLLSLVFVIIAIIVPLLVLLYKNFPWGKILLIITAAFYIAAAILLIVPQYGVCAKAIEIICFHNAALLIVIAFLK